MVRVSASLVKAEMLLDPVKARCVVIDGESEFLDMVVHALHISANALKLGANAVEFPERGLRFAPVFFRRERRFQRIASRSRRAFPAICGG